MEAKGNARAKPRQLIAPVPFLFSSLKMLTEIAIKPMLFARKFGNSVALAGQTLYCSDCHGYSPKEVPPLPLSPRGFFFAPLTRHLQFRPPLPRPRLEHIMFPALSGIYLAVCKGSSVKFKIIVSYMSW